MAVFLALVFFVLFWLFRSQTHFLGDGYIRLRSVAIGNQFIWAEPLDSHIHYLVYNALHSAFGWTSDRTYALVSCLIGSLFVVALVPFSSVLVKDISRRVFIFCAVLLMGSVQLFFGYVEDYTLVLFLLLIYIFVSVFYLQKRCSLFFPAFVLSLAVCTHTSAIIFVPSLLYLFIYEVKKGKSRKRSLLSLGEVACGIALPIVLLLIHVEHVGFSLDHFKKEFTAGSHILPFLAVKDDPNAFRYGILSLTHLSNITNEIILVAPVGLLLGFSLLFRGGELRRKNNPVSIFLLWLAVLALVYIFFLKPDKGASRDWDLFAICSIPWTLCVAYLFAMSSIGKEKFLRMGLILLCVGFFHTFPWIVVNASEEVSIERFRLLMERDSSLSNIALADAFDELAMYFRQNGMEKERIYYCKKAAEVLPTSRYQNNLGASYVDNGMYREAIAVLTEIDDNSSYAANAHYNMGIAYSKLNRLDEALVEYLKAVEMNPQNGNAYFNLASTYLKLNKLQEALSTLHRVNQLNPNQMKVIYSLGHTYLQLENIEESIPYFQKAIQLNPNYAGSHFNLGVAFFKLNRYQDALEEFQKASRLDPENEEPHFNMGLTYLKIGDAESAASEFQQVLQKNPDYHAARVMLEQVEQEKTDDE
ncbi:MAG: tetratricopeptide repeat protein [Gemmatimonadota bacterium]|nr:MAG: tetratricopeptide repeat protein [Gemmatimonadota bacterium]